MFHQLAQRRGFKSRRAADDLAGWLFLLPMLALFLIFVLWPMVKTVFYLGFTDYSMMSEPRWVGLDNYVKLFTQDPNAGEVGLASLRIPLMLVPLHVALSLLIAFLVSSCRSKIVRGFSRTAVYFPVLVTTGSVAVAWSFIFSTDNGPLNWGLARLGLLTDGAKIAWLVQARYALWAIVIFSAWKFIGQYFLYYYVGMQNIPDSYYEAARIDGANTLEIFGRITLPMLTPTIFFVLVIVLTGALQAFDEPFFITGGGPGYYTTNATLYIYRKAFKSYEMGYASAIASVLFLAVFALTLIQLRMQRRWVVYDYE